MGPRRRRLTPYLAAGALLVAAGCTGGEPAGPTTTALPGVRPAEEPFPTDANGNLEARVTADDLDGIAALRAEVAAHRARWEATGINDYTMTYESLYFFDVPRPVTVRIEDGAVVDSDAPKVGDNTVRDLTVTDLFDLAEAALAERAAVVSIILDADLGYPQRLFVGWAADTSDADEGARVFELIPGAPGPDE